MGSPIDDDPALAQAVGRAAGYWALVEMLVEMVFAALVGTDIRRASIVFVPLRSASTQADVVERLADEVLAKSGEAMKALKTCLTTFIKLAPERNRIIHNPFGWDTSVEPPQLYKMLRDSTAEDIPFKMHPISVADINLFVEKAEELRLSLLLTQHLIAKEMRPGSRGLLQSPPPGPSLQSRSDTPEDQESP